MSKMFKDALVTHIDQVKDRINGADPRLAEEELRSLEPLLQRTTDPRLRKALEKRVVTLQNQRRSAGNAEDLKKLLTALQNVYAQIRERPEYNVVRRKRGEGPPRRRKRSGPA